MIITDADIIDILAMLDTDKLKTLRGITEQTKGVKSEHIEAALLYAVQRGFVEALVGDDKIFYRLTTKGHEFFYAWFL